MAKKPTYRICRLFADTVHLYMCARARIFVRAFAHLRAPERESARAREKESKRECVCERERERGRET